MILIKILNNLSNYVVIFENVVSEQTIEEVQEVEAEPVQQTVQGGYSAKALFDYDAGEENEISFQDGAIIIDIEFVSEDWWQGKAPDGNFGLFPGKFVNILIIVYKILFY